MPPAVSDKSCGVQQGQQVGELKALLLAKVRVSAGLLDAAVCYSSCNVASHHPNPDVCVIMLPARKNDDLSHHFDDI